MTRKSFVFFFSLESASPLLSHNASKPARVNYFGQYTIIVTIIVTIIIVIIIVTIIVTVVVTAVVLP